MTARRLAAVASVAISLAAAGCPGDGSAIPDMMNGDLEPTLDSIQARVFGAICVDCHVAGGPGSFMPLNSADASFQNLVNQPSLEFVGLDRVEPGDPEASYLVHKIEGRSGIVGDRMPPPPQSMLAADEIEAIREWILAGAPR